MTRLSNIKAPIYEVFFSYQGEGLMTGLPQIFIRFAGCNIKCSYCDTSYSIKVSKKAKFFTTEELIKKIKQIYTENKKYFILKKPSISFTGGEPLIYSDFLKSLIPALKKEDFSIYLETNGTLPTDLKKIISLCDIVAMDFKFKSDCGKSFWNEHKHFLNIAKNKVYVKCTITSNTKKEEIKKTAELIKSISNKIHLILQPSIDINRPPICSLYEFFSLASQYLKYVHLMPQLHKIYNLK